MLELSSDARGARIERRDADVVVPLERRLVVLGGADEEEGGVPSTSKMSMPVRDVPFALLDVDVDVAMLGSDGVLSPRMRCLRSTSGLAPSPCMFVTLGVSFASAASTLLADGAADADALLARTDSGPTLPRSLNMLVEPSTSDKRASFLTTASPKLPGRRILTLILGSA